MSLVVPKAQLIADLTAKIGLAGALETVHFHLYKASIGPTKETLLATFDANEADYDGYADEGPIVWGEVFFDTDGKAKVIGSNLQFHMTGATTPNTIYGMYATDAAGTTLLFSEEFANPVAMVDADSALSLTPVYSVS